jgi:dehydrogenase/reductase SDR family member 7B
MKPLRREFEGKVVLLTGASSGIGRAMALQLGELGARVALIARRKEVLEEVAQQMGGNALVLAGDITDDAFCQRAVEQTAAHFGRVDWLFNNAGVSMNAAFCEAELSVFHRMMDVNYFGSLQMARHVHPWLLQSKGGVVFISSVVGKRGFPTRSGYSASKFAVHALFESLRVEWAPQGIHVGLVAPGYTDTEIRTSALGADGKPRKDSGYTTGGVMTADHAATAILRAAASRRREVILTAGGKAMVWLNKLFPSLADRVAASVVR